MRTKNSLKNIYIGILAQIVIVFLGFFSRKVFIDNLGTDYLGVNGLLINILSMLSLVEGGIAGSIVYNLYKPLAENNQQKVIALVQIYKKVYSYIAIAVLILSLLIYPLVQHIIEKDTKIPYVEVVYFIFVIKNVISYLNAHKWSLINADQKGYVLAKYNLMFNILIVLMKIGVLIITQNYILFLLIEVLVFIIQNVWNGKIVNDRYPYIKSKIKIPLDKDTQNDLIKNVKALFLHNIGSFCVFGTDNLLIGAFIHVKTVGLYSNYTMIIGQLSALLNPILGGIAASVGNLIAVESSEKSYEIYNVIYFINFLLYSVSAIFLYNLLEPFIDWWLGEGLLLDRGAFIIILINFYITGMRNSIGTFKSKAGIFVQDKYVPLLESVINLASSIILIKYLGLAGIFLGTTISTLLLQWWIAPYLVYKNVFNKSVKEFFKKYLIYVVLTIVAAIITTILCNTFVNGIGLISLVFRGIICILVPSIIYILAFLKSSEFRYLINILKPVIIQYEKIS